MKFEAEVFNVREVKDTIDRYAAQQAKDFGKALMRCGLLVQREAQKVTPVDTGALKNSARTRSEGRGFRTAVFVSFNTSYAVFVHERHKTKGKFLEATYRRLLPQIRKTLIDAMGGVK